MPTRLFAITLHDGDGDVRELGTVEFASLGAACADVHTAIPDAAAELLRVGRNPFDFRFPITDLQDHKVSEVPLNAVLTP